MKRINSIYIVSEFHPPPLYPRKSLTYFCETESDPEVRKVFKNKRVHDLFAYPSHRGPPEPLPNKHSNDTHLEMSVFII